MLCLFVFFFTRGALKFHVLLSQPNSSQDHRRRLGMREKLSAPFFFFRFNFRHAPSYRDSCAAFRPAFAVYVQRGTRFRNEPSDYFFFSPYRRNRAPAESVRHSRVRAARLSRMSAVPRHARRTCALLMMSTVAGKSSRPLPTTELHSSYPHHDSCRIVPSSDWPIIRIGAGMTMQLHS